MIQVDKKFRPELCVRGDKTNDNMADPYYDAAHQRLVATDGRMMVVLPVGGDGDNPSGYIPGKALKEARKIKDPSGMGTMPFDIAPGQVKLTDGTVIPVADHETRTFPNVMKAIPTYDYDNAEDVVRVALNPYLLARIAKGIGVQDKLGQGVFIQIRVDPETRRALAPQPMMVCDPRSDDGRAFGVLMPVTDDGEIKIKTMHVDEKMAKALAETSQALADAEAAEGPPPTRRRRAPAVEDADGQ